MFLLEYSLHNDQLSYGIDCKVSHMFCHPWGPHVWVAKVEQDERGKMFRIFDSSLEHWGMGIALNIGGTALCILIDAWLHHHGSSPVLVKWVWRIWRALQQMNEKYIIWWLINTLSLEKLQAFQCVVSGTWNILLHCKIWNTDGQILAGTIELRHHVIHCLTVWGCPWVQLALHQWNMTMEVTEQATLAHAAGEVAWVTSLIPGDG